MTTPKDKFEPQESPLPELPESEEELLPTFRCGNPGLRDRMRYELLEPLPPSNWLPPIDWLALLGVGSAVVAFLFWAIPAPVCAYYYGQRWCLQEYFSFERLPAIAGFLVLSLILLIARAGNRR